MIIYPHAKLNLGLQITGKRSDGYHLLDSLFLPIKLSDVLEILPSSKPQDSLHVYGGIETGRNEDNLVLRAVRAMRDQYDVPSVEIHLYKHIPSGAGMGGGSSDASFTLRALREMFAFDISDDDLRVVAQRLGADCPFFIRGEPALVSGIGEAFAPAPSLPLEGMSLVLTKPNIHISTAKAFAGLKHIGRHPHSVAEVLAMPIEMWREHLKNDFEESLFPDYPRLADLKQWHYDSGAIYASMTGSGATVFGIYHKPLEACTLSSLSDCFIWQGTL